MPRYHAPDPAEVDELHLPTQPDCTVVMKRRATRGDVFDAEEAMYNLRERQSQNGHAGGGSRVVGFYQALTLCLIVRWDLEDENGVPWPADDIHSLRRLDPLDGVFLEAEARKRTEEPRSGPFGSGSSPQPTDSTPTTSESDRSSSMPTSPEPTAGPPMSSAASARRTSRTSSSSASSSD